MRHKDPTWNVASGCYQRRYDAEGTDSWPPAAPFLLRLIDGARVGRGAFAESRRGNSGLCGRSSVVERQLRNPSLPGPLQPNFVDPFAKQRHREAFAVTGGDGFFLVA
jgi:hypothetical protein